MKEFQYNISENGIKKLVKARFNNDAKIKKDLFIRSIVSSIVLAVALFLSAKELRFNFEISIIFIVFWIVMSALFFPITKCTNIKISTKEYLKHAKAYINKEIFIKFDNENIEIKTDSFTHNYILKKCTILFIDDERIYIKFSDNNMIYIPKDIFKDNNEFNQFTMLFKKL